MFVRHLRDGQFISLGVHSSGSRSYQLNQLRKDKVDLNLMLSTDYPEEERCMRISSLKWPAMRLRDEVYRTTWVFLNITLIIRLYRRTLKAEKKE